MQVAILSRVEITSKKDGQKYFLYKGIDSKGDTIQVFLNADQEVEIGVPQSARATSAQLAEIMKTLPVVDIQFNQQGRLDTIHI